MFCPHPVRKLDNYWLDIILKRLYTVVHNISCNDTPVTFPLAQSWSKYTRSEDEWGHLQAETVKGWTQ